MSAYSEGLSAGLAVEATVKE